MATPATEFRDGLCGICPAGCWVRVELRDGKIHQVEAHPDHPLGSICTIGRHSPQIVHDPDRLMHPLRRVGPKGSHEFERVSWDEAFSTIVSKLTQIKTDFGAEATAIYTGRGSFDMALCDFFQPKGVAVSSASSVLFPFGSPNTLGVGALCYVSFAMIAPHVTMGEMLISLDTDIEQAQLIVVWGANPATDSPPLIHEQILAARRRGAEVVVIDPRRNGTARECEAEWIPLRPGTDGALALGLIQVMLEEELHDESFAKDWTVGFDELAQLTQHYRPELVAGITGVPAETIRSLARRIASARGACPVMYTGLEYSDSGVQAIRAVFTLWALAGQLDVPGGLLVRMKQNLFPQNRSGLIANPDMGKALGRDRFPIYSQYRGESHAIALPRSILQGDPYRIRSLMVLGGSIITSWPNPQLWRETLGALDFLVTIDRYHTADSAYADIVLPATTGYEITSFMRYGSLFRIREKIIEPLGEARSDFLILSELAQRLGYGHLYPQSEEEILQHALAPSPFSLEQVRAAGGWAQVPSVMIQYKKWEKGLLRADGQPGFNTPSGKFEIAASTLTEHGYDALPVYTEPAEGPLARPDLARDFPLILNTGARTVYDFRSQHHGVKDLSKAARDPVVTLNRSDAASRGIGNGDWVWVKSPRGQVKFRARVTDDIVAGSVDAAMGGGGPLGSASWQAANVNDLTNLDHCDPISGFPIYKTLLCQVTRVDGDTNDGSHLEAGDASAASAENRITQHKTVRQVYLDHNATTPVAAEVRKAMLPFLGPECGNPSSIHSRGNQARVPVESARRLLAQTLNCTARRILFTGSGSEANNLALQGTVPLLRKKGRHIVTSAIEHPAIVQTCRALQAQGFDLTVVGVSSSGVIDPAEFAECLRPDTILASVMLVNNETGVIQPVAELAALARQKGIVFHCDAVQALGKIAVDVDQLGVDLLSVSAHKAHGPKGVGALYRRRDLTLQALIYGGDQEQGLRAGTENVAGIVGFGKACQLLQQRLLDGEPDRIAVLRDRLEQAVCALVPGAQRNGAAAGRVANTTSLSLPDIRGESLVLFLDRYGVYCSSGSACKAGHPDPSPALLAMGLSEAQAHCTVRFSLGSATSEADIDHTIQSLDAIVRDTMSAIRFVSCR